MAHTECNEEFYEFWFCILTRSESEIGCGCGLLGFDLVIIGGDKWRRKNGKQNERV